MLKVGESTENPLRGTRILICKTGEDTGNTGFEIEYFIKPQTGREPAAHMHEWWTEEFEILAGSARYVLDGKEKAAQTGDMLTFSRGILHVHPWNVGDSELRMRQVTRFDHASPAAIQDTFNILFSTMNGLARDGKMNRTGMPNPLQLAVMLRELQQHGGYIGGPPPAVQRVLFGGLAFVGRAFGYRPSYPQYTGQPV